MMFTKNRVFYLLLSLVSFQVSAYEPADQQGRFYTGLQNYERIFEIVEPDLSRNLADNNKDHYLENLLAPWHKASVNRALKAFQKDLSPENIELIRPFIDSYPTKNSIFLNAMHPIHWEVLMTTARVAKTGRYFASGVELTSDHQHTYGKLLQSPPLKQFDPKARAITISDAAIQFVPSDEFITNNLYKAGNSASDQKTSEMILPANTPVFVLGQFFDKPSKSPETDSWLAIWRPEFHIRFVRSRHIASLNPSTIKKYEAMAPKGLYMAVSDRVRVRTGLYAHKPLTLNTPLLRADTDYYLAATDETTSINSKNKFRLFQATLIQTSPKVIDPNSKLDHHLKVMPLPFSAQEYLTQLNNTTFINTCFNNRRKNACENIHVSFAWGEGIIGADNFHGQDVSSFIRKLLLPFGISLTRKSSEQLEEGLSRFPVYDSTQDKTSDPDQLYQALVNHCTLGRFVSYGPGSLAACLGSVTLEELYNLDPEAAADAEQHGGITKSDRVPLLALSPLGLKSQNEWYITGRTGVYPVFKKSFYSTWISREQLFIFSYFAPQNHLVPQE